MIKSIYVLLFL